MRPFFLSLLLTLAAYSGPHAAPAPDPEPEPIPVTTADLTRVRLLWYFDDGPCDITFTADGRYCCSEAGKRYLSVWRGSWAFDGDEVTVIESMIHFTADRPPAAETEPNKFRLRLRRHPDGTLRGTGWGRTIRLR
jgi:hypothetical protein